MIHVSTLRICIHSVYYAAIQGVGGGGIQSLTNIVTADLVPLKERGLFNGITGMYVEVRVFGVLDLTSVTEFGR